MNYVIFRFVEGVKMYLGYNDWELTVEQAVRFNSYQAMAISWVFDDCDLEEAK